jgi:hypothetical protein
MPKIAISYRRSDSSAIAGHMFDRLTAHYGENSVFMDIDDIPYGIDFRSHIRDVLQQADVMITLIGANWLGRDAGGAARIEEKADPVRAEIETALENDVPIIPVLVDGAKMPQSSELPPEFGDFAFLNAAEVHSGRDFHTHMNRLIGAIDRAMTVDASVPAPPQQLVANTEISGRDRWFAEISRYFLAPLVLLLVSHHIIVNAFDLGTVYLRIASSLVPLAFGFAFSWVAGCRAGAACAFAIALGITGVVGMTVSQSLSSGDPIMPQTRFEWWDNVNFAAIIILSFVIGHTLARALRAVLNLEFGKL